MSNHNESASLDRRAFFKNVARWSLAGGMAAAVVGATVRARDVASSGASGESPCVNEGICRGCPVFTGCGLPQALSAKKVLGNDPAALAAHRETRT
jgi:hypothetical protein